MKTSSIGMASLLFLIFLVLKLTEAIEWSWVWVFSPYWIPLGLFVIGFIIWVGIEILKENKKKKIKISN